MAFSKQPDINTYSTKTIPLVNAYNTRGVATTKDNDYLNVYFEKVENRDTKESFVDVYTRPGYNVWSGALQSTVVRQVYFWEAQNKWYVWVDNDIQIIDGNSGNILTTVANVFVSTTGGVGVTEFLYDTGDVKLVFTDGDVLATIDSANTVVASVSADLPANMLTSIVFLDGYIFVVNADTEDIVNSNLNDPLAFTAGDYISAEMLPDSMVGISRLNNYLVAFGADSIEYFWDAANATGSPLQRNDTPVKFNGIVNMDTVCVQGNKLFFLGAQANASVALFMLEDFKIRPIGNEAFRKQLMPFTTTNWDGAIVSIRGHDFYVLSGSGTSTWIVDLENPELWSRWAENGGTQLHVRYATVVRQSCYFYVDGRQYLFEFDSGHTLDVDGSYQYMIITPPENFDSYNQKAINRLTVQGDRPEVDTTMTVQWSDDDYQTWQTGQDLNLNQELPCIYQCGSFRRRAHKLTCEPTVPFRVRHLEVDVNLGNS